MFFCYCDESGYCGNRFNPNQPVMVMVGILPNVYNYHRSDAEFREIFEIINTQVPLSEIKAEQIYRGRGTWRDIEPESRDNVINFYLNWIDNRPHKLIVSAVDNARYFDSVQNNPETEYARWLPYPYLFSGFHIALVVQKLNRNKEKNKGKTLLVYDEQDEFSDRLAEIIFDPPHFIDEFVKFDPKHEDARFSQIIDTAFSVKSHHSSMAQVVDIVAYLVRLHLELDYYGEVEAYPGEADKIRAWVDQIRPSFVTLSAVYPSTKKPFLIFINAVKANGIRD